MKRRSFLKLFGLPAALLIPTVTIAKSPKINNDIIVGYKGKIKMDAGYFYAPYIPLQRNWK